MKSGHTTRRRFLANAGGILVVFTLAAAFHRFRSIALEATIAPEPGAPAVTPPIDPGFPATHATQTQQVMQTRNVDRNQLDSYLEFGEGGHVTVYAGKVELGTGITTALAQIVAEELDVAVERVTMIQGDTAITPDQGTTAGSKTIQGAGPVLQQAAAEARLALLSRAAAHFGIPADELIVIDGVVTSKTDPGKRVSYGELATEPFHHEMTGDAPVKPSGGLNVVGQSIPRVDLLAKLTGGEAFIQDLKLDGMVHGRILRPHVRTVQGVGATVVSVDDSDVTNMPGFIDVVRNGSFIGVVAEREEQAIRASEALRVTWSEPEHLPDFNKLHDLMRQMPAEKSDVITSGDVDAALANASKTLRATYLQPFQAHAPLGPSCAVADVRADSATIYSSSQGVYALRVALAPILGLSVDQVRVIFREGAGCYGHDGSDDVSADAALLSQAVGRPVRVQWSRQDEFAWEPKGPAMISDLRGGLDDEGNIVAWGHEVWTPTHATRPNGKPGNLLAGQLMDPPAEFAPLGKAGGTRNAPINYVVPNQHVVVNWIQTPPLRPSALRSLGGVANTTANESFLDELATLAGADPIEFRLRHLGDPRAIAVVERAATRFGWKPRVNTTQSSIATRAASQIATGRGFAFVRYENEYTYVALAVAVEVDTHSGAIRVNRVVVAHDCGRIINPDGLTNQIEGNVIQGMSRALHEEVTFDETQVTSLNLSTYRILGFAEVPKIEVELIDRPEAAPWGAGEPAICPVRAAISNAVFDATGIRLRQAPYTPDRVLAGTRPAGP
jgi:CO/xanthine dehydrogenase Mo-binding subunit